MRNAVAARLITWRVPLLSTLSPLMRLSGHNPNHEAKCASVFHRAHVQPHLADHGLGYQHVYAVNSRQIHAADPIQLAAQVKLGPVARGFLAPLGQLGCFGSPHLLPLPLLRWWFFLRELRWDVVGKTL